MERKCLSCRKMRDIGAFVSDAPSAKCAECRAKSNSLRRAKYNSDPDWRKFVLKRNSDRAKAHPEYTKRRNREWREANLEAALKTSRETYWRNPEKARADKLAAYYADKAPVIERNRKKRVRDAGNEVLEVTVRDIERLLVRCNHECVDCGKHTKLSIDHIIPVSRGGRHAIGNLTIRCNQCNASKRDKTVMEWRMSKMRRDLRCAS